MIVAGHTAAPGVTETSYRLMMPEYLKDRLAARAAAEDRSMASLIRRALEQYLDYAEAEARELAGPPAGSWWRQTK